VEPTKLRPCTSVLPNVINKPRCFTKLQSPKNLELILALSVNYDGLGGSEHNLGIILECGSQKWAMAGKFRQSIRKKK